MNSHPRVAIRYHQATKHSVQSVYRNRHTLDWDNQPLKVKIYLELRRLPLPADLPQGRLPAIQAVNGSSDANREIVPDLSQLAYILYCSAGITKKLLHPQGEFVFRAAASAGALYPIEIYLVSGDLPGLKAGVYHFNPADFSLRQLRDGDLRGVLVQASGEESAVRHAPLILVFTAITWRSAWKYQARSYRYHFWDCGTMLANALASSAAQELPAKVVMGFVDGQVNGLLGLNGEFEKSLCLFPVGYTAAQPSPTPQPVPDIDPAVVPLSRTVVDYPIIAELHTASSLESPEQVVRWRGLPLAWNAPQPAGQRFQLQPMDEASLLKPTFQEVVVQRGSSRRFKQESISIEQLSTILNRSISGFRSDWLDEGGELLNDLYLSVHAVDGLTPGAYIFHRGLCDLQLLKEGNFRGQAAHLCLGQDLGGDASATLFFLADLSTVLKRYGNRGYRLVQMEAGILGGRIYLSAYTLGLGASGLTFYDDDVVGFFSPHASGLEAVFVVALGVPARSGPRRGRMVPIRPGEPVQI